MSTAPVTSQLAVVTAGEPTLFDSLARLVPEELQAEYYRVLAHTRTLNPDDEMLRILEAMGVLALITRHTPKDIADERERLQEMLDLHRQSSNEAQQKMLGYVRELEARISALPGEIEAGLDPQQIAKLLGESLRQHFLQSGITATVNGLQTTNTALTAAQKELSSALRALSDSHGGIVAQVESANKRLTYSLEGRAKTVDSLLHELKGDLLHIWIPLACGATLLVGMFCGMEIQGCRDSPTEACTRTVSSCVQGGLLPPWRRRPVAKVPFFSINTWAKSNLRLAALEESVLSNHALTDEMVPVLTPMHAEICVEEENALVVSWKVTSAESSPTPVPSCAAPQAFAQHVSRKSSCPNPFFIWFYQRVLDACRYVVVTLAQFSNCRTPKAGCRVALCGARVLENFFRNIYVPSFSTLPHENRSLATVRQGSLA